MSNEYFDGLRASASVNINKEAIAMIKEILSGGEYKDSSDQLIMITQIALDAKSLREYLYSLK